MQIEIINADKKIRYTLDDVWALAQPVFLFLIVFYLGRSTNQFMLLGLMDKLTLGMEIIVAILLIYVIICESRYMWNLGIYQEINGKKFVKKLQRILEDYDFIGAELVWRRENYVILISLRESKVTDPEMMEFEIPFRAELAQTDHAILDMRRMILYYPVEKINASKEAC